MARNPKTKKKSHKAGSRNVLIDGDSSCEKDEPHTETRGSSSKVPSLEARTVAHQGCVNRIRAMSQQPHIVATWSDSGYVQVWDMGIHVRALVAETASEPVGRQNNAIRQAPLYVFTGHKDEGFAIEWSLVTSGRLVTGDCKSGIHLWEPSTAGSWNIDKATFTGHNESLEDLQWSPKQADVFATCSVDGTVRIWDIRKPPPTAMSFKAHEADVNVISWNRVASCMIASDCDDGMFRIWDFCLVENDSCHTKDASFVAHFKYHRAPITSIEWNPYESSTLIATSADHQLTVWDLSLEDEEADYQAQVVKRQQASTPTDLPPQLLFVHLGQTRHQRGSLASSNSRAHCFNSRGWLQCHKTIKFGKFASGLSQEVRLGACLVILNLFRILPVKLIIHKGPKA